MNSTAPGALLVGGLALMAIACGLGEEGATHADSATRSGVSGLEIQVPGDYATIQAAIDAASSGDTVAVAAGDYTENVRLKSGVNLIGAGAEVTHLRGQIKFYLTENAEVAGFHLDGDGVAGISPDIGLAGAGCGQIRLHDNIVEGFASGIGLEACSEMTVAGNLVRLNQYGIEMAETDTTRVANNVIHHNQYAGIVLFYDAVPDIAHNTIVGNGYGQDLADGGSGVVLGPNNFAHVENNIVVSNHGGINALDTTSTRRANLVWGNAANYVGSAAAGPGDIALDPRFINPGAKDYRIQDGSPAVDAGADIGWVLAADFDGNPRPTGAGPDLGAFELQTPAAEGDFVINEVMANPLEESTGEFVELYNPTDGPLDAAGLVLDDGDSPDALVAHPLGGATEVPAGGFAVVLDRDYLPDTPYDIPEAAVLLSVPNAALGSGLSTSDPVTLRRSGAVISAYAHPFNPGDGLSAERIDPDGPDEPDNWVTSPCGSSPGRANCIASGGAPSGLPSLVISEVMANPTDQSLGEYVEVYNYGDDPIELAGLVLSDGDANDTLIAVAGRASELVAGEHGIVIDPDYVSAMTGPPYDLTSEVAVVVTVTGSALGNGLAANDPVAILLDDGTTPIATFSHPLPTASQSIERVDLLEADLADNWIPSPCAALHSAGRPNCASAPGATVEVPNLVINEVMANALDEDEGEFVEIYNPTSSPVDAAGLLLSDGDATDVIGAFPGLGGDSAIPARGFGVVLDPEYAGDYAIPSDAVWLAPDDTTLGNGLATTDPIVLYASDGRTEVSTFSFPFNPGNGISVERKGDTGDIETNWVASTCADGASPGAHNCASGAVPEPPPGAGLVISEVMANPVDEARGEFVEIVNRGSEALILEGYGLSDEDAVDTIQSYDGGSTELLPGQYAVVLDQSYAELAPAPYLIPAGAVRLTTDDRTIGSGLTTDDPVILLAPDLSTVVSTYGFPFDPGDGVSVERFDLDAADAPDNWGASTCTARASPGALNCAGGQDPDVVVDVNTASQADLEQVSGIGPATAGAIVSYRTDHGPFESLAQLTVIDGITSDKINQWRVAEEGESEYVIGLDGARDVAVFAGVGDLLAALPGPLDSGAASWEGTPVRIQRAVALDASDWEGKQQLTFADWGDESQFEPSGGTQIAVFLDSPGEAAYARSQTNHANAMEDWVKDDGDPYQNPGFYRWSTPLWSYGEIAYAHVFALEGVVEVDGDEWRLRIRADADPGIDRVVLVERWLDADDWERLEVVWTYGYKPVVVTSTSGWTYSLPYRLALAHPVRQFWLDEHGVWLDVPRCPRFGECADEASAWSQYNVALEDWAETPVTGTCVYPFSYDGVDYCFLDYGASGVDEEAVGVEILNQASLVNLIGHCYTTTLANIVLANRPFSSIAEYDATAGVGDKSLWNLLVCYVRPGHWPPAAEGTVERVVQDIPGNEWLTVTIDEADVTYRSATDPRLFEICDPPDDTHCIHVFSWETLPATLSVGDSVTLRGQVRYYSHDGIWEIQISGEGEYVTILEEG